MMKRKIAGVLLCALSLIGCSNEVEKPTPAQDRITLDTSSGQVVVQDVLRNPDEKCVSASVLGDEFSGTVRLMSIGDGATTAGSRAELLDASGRLLFSFETLVDSDTGEMTITQATPDDYLTLSKRTDDERVWERYDANGDVASFEYPALSDDDQNRAANYYHHGLSAERLPADASAFVTVLGEFDAYYAPHASSTLRDNPSGELLLQIVTSSEFPSLVQGNTPEPERWKWIELACTTARACMTLICHVNPDGLVCMVCWAVSVICTFYAL